MSETKWTPGPWTAGTSPWPEQIGCCPLIGRPYDIHGDDYLNVAAATTIPNAHLIAAAPDLYAALVEAAEFIQPFNKAQDLLDRIDAALSRARGEKP